MVDLVGKAKRPDLLEAAFTIQCNDYFHRISETVKEEVGSLDSKRILEDWTNWIKREIKKKVRQGAPVPTE